MGRFGERLGVSPENTIIRYLREHTGDYFKVLNALSIACSLRYLMGRAGKMNNIYVGVKLNGRMEEFRSKETPREEDYPKYNHVIGPFRTVRGARFMRDYGKDNPHCQTVSDAERLGRIQ